MTPLGHLSVSYLAGKTTSYLFLPAILIGGILPDLDFLLLPFSFFNNIHRVISHNLLFAGIATGITFIWFYNHRSRKAITLGVLAGILLHLFTDSILDNNPGNGVGIALLWPFSDTFVAPFNLSATLSAPGWDQPIGQIKATLQQLYQEIPFWMAAFGLLLVDWFKTGKTANPKF